MSSKGERADGLGGGADNEEGGDTTDGSVDTVTGKGLRPCNIRGGDDSLGGGPSTGGEGAEDTGGAEFRGGVEVTEEDETTGGPEALI